MLNTTLMFSSKTGKWDTPQSLIDDLAPLFPWDLDVCASRPNVCMAYLDEEDSGLTSEWFGLMWMNPPYGREIGAWVNRAADRSINGYYVQAVVCLLPARTDTRWWQDNIVCASQVVFIRGRLKFGDAAGSAPFPSAFVVFGELDEAQRDKLGSYGWDVRMNQEVKNV